MMKQYDYYKTTDIPWLNKIPEHWKLLRNAIIFRETKDIVGVNYKQYTLLSLTINGVIKRDIVSGKGKFPASFETYKKVKQGDIIFCLFDIDETPRTVGLSQYNGMITGAYDIFSILNDNKYYIYYYYLSLDFFKQLKPLYSGLRKTIKINKFFSVETPIPPREEQDKIVAYLDYQTSNINKLILNKRKQIELLEEYKKTKISEVVTKGLNPTVEMKDSGIDWIGQIPKHWEVKRIKEIGKFINEKNGKYNNNLTYIALENIISFSGKVVYTNNNYNISQAIICKQHDVLFGKLRPYLAKVYICENNIYCSQEFAVFRAIYIHHKYIFFIYISQIFIDLVDASTYGTKMPRVNNDFIQNINIPFPPLNEQKEIADYLDNLTLKLDKLVDKHKLYIERLEEYKKTLISDVVTGKIDVRDVTIPKYEKVEIVDNIENNANIDELNME